MFNPNLNPDLLIALCRLKAQAERQDRKHQEQANNLIHGLASRNYTVQAQALHDVHHTTGILFWESKLKVVSDEVLNFVKCDPPSQSIEVQKELIVLLRHASIDPYSFSFKPGPFVFPLDFREEVLETMVKNNWLGAFDREKDKQTIIAELKGAIDCQDGRGNDFVSAKFKAKIWKAIRPEAGTRHRDFSSVPTPQA